MSEGFTVREDPVNYAYHFFVGSSVDDAELDVYEFRVYAHLMRRANGPTGRASCGLTDIANSCRISRGQAHAAVHSLCAKGAIAIEKFHDKRKNQERNGYVITDRRTWCPEPKATVHEVNSDKPGTVHIVNGTGHAVNGTVHDMTSNCSRGEPKVCPKEGNPQKEETTTTTPPACAPQPEPAPAEETVVVVFSGSGFEEEEKRRDERLEALRNDFRLNPTQVNELRRIAKDRGVSYVEGCVEHTRKNAKRNKTAYLLKLLREEAQITAEPERKAERHLKPEPKPEEALSESQADFSAELAWWQSATDAQREDVLRDPRFDLYRKSMRKGVTAASLGLPVLREVLTELAQEAACAASALVKAQPPGAAAA